MSRKLFAYALLFFILTFVTVAVSADDLSGLIGEERDLTPAEVHAILGKLKASRLELKRAAEEPGGVTKYSQTDFDASFYSVNLAIDIPAEQISGEVYMEARSLANDLDTVVLDFHDALTVDSIYSAGEQLDYSLNGGELVVELDRKYAEDESFAFSVVYHGQPVQQVGFQGFAFDERNGIPVVSTLSEPYMARTWWPCKDRPDDKADSMDIFVTCDTAYYCASNGSLVDTTSNGDGTRTFSYEVRYPIATYLFSLAISDYIVWRNYYIYGADDSLEIVHHVYPDRFAYSQSHYHITPIAMGIFSGLFGDYPFLSEKYGHANFEWGGGMEHQTCTSMSGTWFGFYEPVVVHELAHQWWGDMITCESWHDIWLNEGFASYSEALYYEQREGTASYHSYMAGMEYYGDRTIYVYDTASVSNIFDVVVYDKGAWLLHMLRHVVGNEVFFDILTAYYGSSAQYSHMNSEAFKNLCETVSGQELDYFFDQWLYGTYRPSYAYERYTEQDPSDGSWLSYVYLRQGQATEPLVFSMPIDFVVSYSAGDPDTIVIFNDVRDTVYTIKTDDEPTGIALDPQKWILRFAAEVGWGYHIIPSIPDSGTQMMAYADTVVARGGTGEHRYSIVAGGLPPGLELDSISGVIFGFPSDYGEFIFTVKARDRFNIAARDSAELTVYIAMRDGLPGDANLDGEIDLLDVLFLIDYLYEDGPLPDEPTLVDVDHSCSINLLDILGLIDFLYGEGGFIPQMGCAVL
ncbi:MAG: putative Ig domain-containing protein [Candidatus Zixiibacteriota bacterium]|nr:MAG: putative Ig domain-containing protein [candidate division Zixibacteria bacterium]